MIPSTSRSIQRFFPQVMWRNTSEDIALTFDDGPHPVTTPAILKVLDTYRVQATFFFLGSNVRSHPDLVRETARQGHSIANHARDHELLIFRSKEYVMNQIRGTQEAIQEITGAPTVHFRPPFGYFRPDLLSALRELDHRLVMWSIDPRDWSHTSSAIPARQIIAKAARGSILLLHDNERTATIAADILRQCLDALLPRFRFSKLS